MYKQSQRALRSEEERARLDRLPDQESSRAELSRRVCEALGIRDARGRLRQASCSVALRELDAAGLIQSPPPPRRRGGGLLRRLGQAVPLPANVPERVDRVAGLRPIPVETADQRLLWTEMAAREHPWGAPSYVGRQLRYRLGAWLAGGSPRRRSASRRGTPGSAGTRKRGNGPASRSLPEPLSGPRVLQEPRFEGACPVPAQGRSGLRKSERVSSVSGGDFRGPVAPRRRQPAVKSAGRGGGRREVDLHVRAGSKPAAVARRNRAGRRVAGSRAAGPGGRPRPGKLGGERVRGWAAGRQAAGGERRGPGRKPRLVLLRRRAGEERSVVRLLSRDRTSGRGRRQLGEHSGGACRGRSWPCASKAAAT